MQLVSCTLISFSRASGRDVLMLSSEPTKHGESPSLEDEKRCLDAGVF